MNINLVKGIFAYANRVIIINNQNYYFLTAYFTKQLREEKPFDRFVWNTKKETA
jgi:hypothetical protein